MSFENFSSQLIASVLLSVQGDDAALRSPIQRLLQRIRIVGLPDAGRESQDCADSSGGAAPGDDLQVKHLKFVC